MGCLSSLSSMDSLAQPSNIFLMQKLPVDSDIPLVLMEKVIADSWPLIYLIAFPDTTVA